jgi:hypothetical protein
MITAAAVVWKTIRQKKITLPIFIWVSLLGAAYALFNYYLIYQVLFSGEFVSHREFWIPQGYNWKVVVWAAYDMFVHGHYHAASYHFITMVLVPLHGKRKALVLLVLKLSLLHFYSFYSLVRFTHSGNGLQS